MMTKIEMIKYYESGQHNQVVAEILNSAKKKLEDLCQKHKNEQKLAIVLDIDDTTLNNYHALKAHDFPATHEIWHDILERSNIPVFLPTLAFYQYCLQKGLHVFFVTARLPKCKASTIKALDNAGYCTYSGLYLLPEGTEAYHEEVFKNFKETARKDIESKGFHILMCVGDQQSDLDGGHTESIVKLPNYLYGELRLSNLDNPVT
jgi:predicted secreted acid phosphatase